MIKFNNKIIFPLILCSFLVGSQSLKDGLEGNKKSKNAEEFLIEKKNPLVLPPDYSKLPVPNNEITEDNKSNEFDLNKILKTKTDINEKSQSNKNSSLNKSILDKIKNN